MTDLYDHDAQVLAEIGRSLARASLPKIEVRLPEHLAQQAVAAWERDESLSGGTQGSESARQHRLRYHAATLALIGLALTQDGRWHGDQAIVELDSAFIGIAIAAADDPSPPLRRSDITKTSPPDGGSKP
jgi:hypothetical protein